jgi:hypothetical protein
MRWAFALVVLVVISASMATTLDLSPNKVNIVKSAMQEKTLRHKVIVGELEPSSPGSFSLRVVNGDGCPTYFSEYRNRSLSVYLEDKFTFYLDVLPVLDGGCSVTVIASDGSKEYIDSVNLNIRTRHYAAGIDYILATDINLYGYFIILLLSILVIVWNER